MVRRAHGNAKSHGFYTEPVEIGTAIALIHSELSEALEEVRKGKIKKYHTGFYVKRGCIVVPKPEGLPTELADVVIRVADLCGYLGIDLEEAIEEKMEYNESRPYKHGKKF